jgi:hypothetical protein
VYVSRPVARRRLSPLRLTFGYAPPPMDDLPLELLPLGFNKKHVHFGAEHQGIRVFRIPQSNAGPDRLCSRPGCGAWLLGKRAHARWCSVDCKNYGRRRLYNRRVCESLRAREDRLLREWQTDAPRDATTIAAFLAGVRAALQTVPTPSPLSEVNEGPHRSNNPL